MVDENRPCCGTTITINGLFHKQPIRCKRLNAAQVITDVTHMVQAFCVALSGKVSLSLRDEQRNKVLLNTSHCKSISGGFKVLTMMAGLDTPASIHSSPVPCPYSGHYAIQLSTPALHGSAYCKTKLFCELKIFAIEPFASIFNSHLFSMSFYIAKAEPRTQKL